VVVEGKQELPIVEVRQPRVNVLNPGELDGLKVILGGLVSPRDLTWGDGLVIALGAVLIVLAIFAWRWYRG